MSLDTWTRIVTIPLGPEYDFKRETRLWIAVGGTPPQWAIKSFAKVIVHIVVKVASFNVTIVYMRTGRSRNLARKDPR